MGKIQDQILKHMSKIMIPLIQIFGIYVILHGHLSPGGGFAGGTILGSSLILERMVQGKEVMSKKYNEGLLQKVICIALISYGALKGYSFFVGGNHLDLPQLPIGTLGNIFSGGSLVPLNIAVGLIVSITVYIFFSLFDEGEI